MTGRLARAAVFLTIFLLTTGFDQGSKQWAHTLPVAPADCSLADLAAHRCAGVPQPLIEGFWDWELAMNRGAAFSSFTGDGAGRQLVLSGLALIALIGIGVVAARSRPDQHLYRIALAIIAGGALGNLIDRLRDGAVTDFVRWRWNDHAWPIFNVADAALVIGVALLVIDQVREHRQTVHSRARGV